MHISEVEMYREAKDNQMRENGYRRPAYRDEDPNADRYVKDQFGGPHGTDPSFHGSELL